jgi:hypothetical protein
LAVAASFESGVEIGDGAVTSATAIFHVRVSSWFAGLAQGGFRGCNTV